MSDEINFLPEKEKEQKEKEQAKKVKTGVKFYTPEYEPSQSSKGEGLFPTVTAFLKKIKPALKEIFKFEKKAKPAEADSKKPVQLTAKPGQAGNKFQVKKPFGGLMAAKPEPPHSALGAGKSSLDLAGDDDLEGDYSEVDVNLMPWQDPSVKRLRTLSYFLLVMSILGVAVWGSLLRFDNQNKAETIDQLNRSIADTDRQLAQINAELFSQSNDIAVRQREFVNLYSNIPRWSKFLTWLELTTHKEVYYTDLNSVANEITIPVVASDYDTAIQQWLAFRSASEWVDAISILSIDKGAAEGSGEKTSFDAKIQLREGVLKISHSAEEN